MRPRNPRREFAFLISDVARLLRTHADQRARQFGMTRAQWAVLARLESNEGLKQSELAEMLDLQPITLTRLVDRLCANGLIERRADPDDRRAKRLYLTPAARPLMDRLAELGQDMMKTVLEGFDLATDRADDPGALAHQGKPQGRHCRQGRRETSRQARGESRGGRVRRVMADKNVVELRKTQDERRSPRPPRRQSPRARARGCASCCWWCCR